MRKRHLQQLGRIVVHDVPRWKLQRLGGVIVHVHARLRRQRQRRLAYLQRCVKDPSTQHAEVAHENEVWGGGDQINAQRALLARTAPPAHPALVRAMGESRHSPSPDINAFHPNTHDRGAVCLSCLNSLQFWNVQCLCCELVPVLPRLQHQHQQLVDLCLQQWLLNRQRWLNAGLLW